MNRFCLCFFHVTFLKKNLSLFFMYIRNLFYYHLEVEQFVLSREDFYFDGVFIDGKSKSHNAKLF